MSLKFGDVRRTEITLDMNELCTEDLIEDKTVLVSITKTNYIKRMDLDTYRKQKRGGHGVTGMTTKEDDVVSSVYVAGMKDYLLCFTNMGRVYWLKVYQIPESSRVAKGKPIVNLLNLKDEIITTVIPIREFRPDKYLMFATKLGQVIKIPETEFSNPRSTGTNAIKLKENGQLVDVIMTDNTREVVLSTRFGYGVRFHEDTVRIVNRNAQGVIGIRFRDEEDTVCAITLVDGERTLLTVSNVGFGKRTEFDEFRGISRGSKGVRTMVLEREAVVIESKAVAENDEIFVMTESGVVIRTPVSGIRIISRGTKGVRIMRLEEKDKVVGIAVVPLEMENGSGDDSSVGDRPEK